MVIKHVIIRVFAFCARHAKLPDNSQLLPYDKPINRQMSILFMDAQTQSITKIKKHQP